MNTAKVVAERSLSTAMDSVLAEYYGPLWEEYQIFGYHAAADGNTERSQEIADKLTDYMSYTFEPGKGLEQKAIKSANELYDISIASVTAEQQTKLMDYNGELLINEAVEYMKYQEVGTGIEKLLDKCALLEAPQKVSAVYEDKLEAEEKLAAIDINVLKLMKLFDGIDTSRKGIALDGEGQLQTTDYFIKMLCSQPVTSETVGINNDIIFTCLKGRYINPDSSLSKCQSDLAYLEQSKQTVIRLREELKANEAAYESAKAQLSASISGKQKTKAEKAKVKEADKALQGIEEAGRLLAAELTSLQISMESRSKEVEQSIGMLLDTLDRIEPLITEAMLTIDVIRVTASGAAKTIGSFEETLNKNQGEISGDLLEELKADLDQMKSYGSSSEKENGYIGMRAVLDQNLKILSTAKGYLKEARSDLRAQSYVSSANTLGNCSNSLKSYEINSLKLDYSSLVLDKTKQKNPLKEMKSILGQGLTSLVIDMDSLSSKKLSNDMLPSEEAAMIGEDSDFATMITEFIQSYSFGDKETNITGLLTGFCDTTDLMSGIGEGVNQITEKVLFQEYLGKYFMLYPMEGNEVSDRKPSALDCEQEYLISGENTDQENMAAVISRIVFIRMMTDFVCILGDKTKGAEALAAATALVGFTGMPVLISITKTVLLLVWALAEALLDTCALLNGKSVPLMKKHIIMTFPELFMINRSYLESKVSQLEAGKLAFTYQDYLKLFLLIKNKKDLAFRSMDLMQENLQLRYGEDFQMSNCLYGFEANVEFYVESKFFTIPFAITGKGKAPSGYQLSLSREYSY